MMRMSDIKYYLESPDASKKPKQEKIQLKPIVIYNYW